MVVLLGRTGELFLEGPSSVGSSSS